MSALFPAQGRRRMRAPNPRPSEPQARRPAATIMRIRSHLPFANFLPVQRWRRIWSMSPIIRPPADPGAAREFPVD